MLGEDKLLLGLDDALLTVLLLELDVALELLEGVLEDGWLLDGKELLGNDEALEPLLLGGVLLEDGTELLGVLEPLLLEGTLLEGTELLELKLELLMLDGGSQKYRVTDDAV